MNRLVVRSRVHACPLDLPYLRRIVRALARDLPQIHRLELGVYLVEEEEMTRLNETFLRHRGVTDVITFNYNDAGDPESIHAEIFVCLDEARTQARRFGTRWEQELVRYIVHGSLHLAGYDDRRKAARLRMKRRENALLTELTRKFALGKLGGNTRVKAMNPAHRAHRHPSK